MNSYSNTVNTHGTLGNPLCIVISGKIDALTKPFYFCFSRDSETLRTLATSSNESARYRVCKPILHFYSMAVTSNPVGIILNLIYLLKYFKKKNQKIT